MFQAYIFAILASIFWGAGFIGSRFGLASFGPMWVIFFRFAIAAIFLIPLLRGLKKSEFSKELIIGSFVSAFFLTTLMFFQVKGLQYTTVAKSSFITITYAFLTPLFCALFFKEKVSYLNWGAIVSALFGILLLCDLKISGFNYGDFLTFICAIFSAFHILAVSHYAKKLARLALFNILQMLFVAAISLIFAITLEGTAMIKSLAFIQDTKAIGGLIFMGLFSTSIAFMFQTKCQQVLKPYVAGIIFLMESPFAALLGFLIFKETLSYMAIAGCVVVILSIIVILFEKQVVQLTKQLSKKIRMLLGDHSYIKKTA